jgi:hypothetical protein
VKYKICYNRIYVCNIDLATPYEINAKIFLSPLLILYRYLIEGNNGCSNKLRVNVIP